MHHHWFKNILSTSFCYSFFPAEGKSFHWFWLAGSNFSFTSSEFTIHCKDPQIKWKQTEPSGETLSINNILFTLTKALSEWKGPGCWLFPVTAVWNLEEELLHHVLSEVFLKQIQSYWLKKIILSFNQAINLLDNFATISRNTWLVKSERHGILTYLTSFVCVTLIQVICLNVSSFHVWSTRHRKVIHVASLCSWSKCREHVAVWYPTWSIYHTLLHLGLRDHHRRGSRKTKGQRNWNLL